jgi:hypothetical protein
MMAAVVDLEDQIVPTGSLICILIVYLVNVKD